jgi:hypothetical protein
MAVRFRSGYYGRLDGVSGRKMPCNKATNALYKRKDVRVHGRERRSNPA